MKDQIFCYNLREDIGVVIVWLYQIIYLSNCCVNVRSVSSHVECLMQPWLLGGSVPCTLWSHHLSSAPWLQVSQRELLSAWRQRARQKALSYIFWGFTFKGLSHYGYCLVQLCLDGSGTFLFHHMNWNFKYVIDRSLISSLTMNFFVLTALRNVFRNTAISNTIEILILYKK